MPQRTRDQVFVSYSHLDQKWLEMLQVMLKPMIRNRTIRVWTDTEIAPGDKWKDKINDALASAKVAVLLVTPHFLASDFIAEHELPRLLDAAVNEGLVILWVAVSPSMYKETEIGEYQAANDPTRPLASLPQHEVEEELVAICQKIKTAMTTVKDSSPSERDGGVTGRTGAPPQICNLPFQRNLNFTGRASLLNQLHEAVGSGLNTALTAISGLAGVGKTQLAVEYAYHHGNEYKLIWWLRSDDSVTLAADYASLASKLNLPERNEAEQHRIVDAVKTWLETNSNWLLIFDNASDRSLVGKYLPQGRSGHVLITSRNPVWGNLALPLTIPLWSESEAVSFLLARTGSKDEKAATELADLLGYLPLALEQAGAYVEETGRTLSYYLDLFRTNQSLLLGRASQATEHSSVAATWKLSLAEIKPMSPAAADLLNLFAFFAADSIPLRIIGEEAHRDHLTELPESLQNVIGNAVALDEAVMLLRKYSLVTVRDDELSVHRLVQAVVRDQLPETDAKIWIKLVGGLLSCAFPRYAANFDTWRQSDKLLSHVLKIFEEAEVAQLKWFELAKLLHVVSQYFKTRAEYDKGQEFSEKALYHVESLYGSKSEYLVAVLGTLGNLSMIKGEWDRAQSCCERALAIAESLYGKDDPRNQIPAHNLGSFFTDRGRLEEARPLLEFAFTAAMTAEPPNYADQVSRTNALALLKEKQGESEFAGELYAFALDIARRVYGPNDPHLLESLNNRATSLATHGDPQQAIPLFEEAIRISQEAYGTSHPSLGEVYCNFATALKGTGEVLQAKEYSEKALEIFNESLGPDHPQLSWALNNLGAVLCELDDFKTGLPYLSRALEISLQHLGLSATRTIQIQENVALFAAEQGVKAFETGDYADASMHLSTALAIRPNVSDYTYRALAHAQCGDHAAAHADLSMAIELEPDDADLYSLRGRMSVVLENQENAISDFSKAIKLDPGNSTLYKARGVAHEAMKQHDAATDDLSKAIDLSPDEGQLYFLRGTRKYRQKDFTGALPDLRRTVELLPDKRDAWSFLGRTCYEIADYESALHALNRAIAIEPSDAFSHHWRAAVRYQLGNLEEALSDFERAGELGFEDPENAAWIADLNYELGDYAAAISAYKKAIEAFPNRALLYHRRGACYGADDNFEAALPDFTKAIELSPDDATFYDWRGQTLGRLENYEAALADFEKAIELQPDNAHYFQVRGQIQNKLGNDAPALADFEMAIELEPENLDHRAWRAVTHLNLGNYTAARETLEFEFANGTFYWWRGLINFALQNYGEAISDLTNAISSFEADENIYVKRAQCFLGCGQYTSALEDLDRASELNPSYAPTQFWYAVARHLMGSEAEISKDFAEAAQISQAAEDSEERNLLLARVALLTEDLAKAVEHYSTLTKVCGPRTVLVEICAMNLLKRLFPANQGIEDAKAFLEGKINVWDTATITIP